MPATVVGLSSFPECVAIRYERMGHSQLYQAECPVEDLTLPGFSRLRTLCLPTMCCFL